MAAVDHNNPNNGCGTWPRAGLQGFVPPQDRGSTLPSPQGKGTLQINRVEKKRHPVQRAPSRLYHVDRSNPRQDKYRGPTTCIGPEFVVRAANPPRIIHIGDIKPALRRKLVVILLNGQKVEITCDPSSTTAAQIFEVIVESEGISENFTLGLAVLVSGDFVFLPPEVRLHKMAPSGWGNSSQKHHPYYSFTLYLKVKFFLTPLRGFRCWSWKHLLYLQLRRCLLERQLRCETKDMMLLAGLALQAEFGDFNVEEHGCGDYFLLEHYLPEGMWREGESVVTRELQSLHRERQGLDPGRAEEMFVSYTQRLPEYGTHHYSAVTNNADGTSAEVWLGVNSEGVVVCLKKMCSAYSARNPTQVHKWVDIRKLCYNKQVFELSTLQDSAKHKFKLDNNKSFCVFRLASLHHKFFQKYKSNMCSMQVLAEEFGIPVKRNTKDSTKCVYYIGSSNSDVRVEDKTSLLRRSASFFSPDRVIFRGKTSTHCGEKKHAHEDGSSSRTDSESVSSCSTNPKSFTIPKQWTPNRLRDEAESAPSSLCTVRKQDFLESTKSTVGRRGLGVRMGTRAFFSSSQVNMSFTEEHSPPHSPLPEAYVLNSSIKSVDDHFHVDFQETISESLAEKFNNIPFVDERILTTVRLKRDHTRGLGIQVTEGSDGGVYIQSIVPGGAAEKLGLVYTGDQIQAVNGQNILSMQYAEAVQLLAETPGELELVLSQVNRGQEVVPPPHSSDYVPGETAGLDLHAALVQKPIEDSYLRVIRYETATEAEEKMVDTALPVKMAHHHTHSLRPGPYL
ncbi:tyrosine-protein phosphatase non-receptor type 13-like [Homalodisca vitripennis]|nr:tyrosine-protein phosphatase non-receptor type 13-like [Homalodisca vitripennis]XP_046673005.1 tyrosine-protein phosphatase non-receptor type 13-like [Homalodisca vitripennis]KAG8272728.1 Tyrosine-protein phosphatase non-receptor type 13 [Homalodisca vitripennis]